MGRLVNYAKDPVTDEPIVTGKIQVALAQFWIDGVLKTVHELPLGKIPYQANNIDRWLVLARQEVRSKLFVSILSKSTYDGTFHCDIEVNQGEGKRRGKAGNINTFSWHLYPKDPESLGYVREARLDIIITSKAHALIHYERMKREGKPVNGYKPKAHPTLGGSFMDDD